MLSGIFIDVFYFDPRESLKMKISVLVCTVLAFAFSPSVRANNDLTNALLALEKAEKENKEIREYAQSLYEKLTGLTETGEKRTTQEYLLGVTRYYENIIDSIPASLYWKDLNGIYRGGSKKAQDLSRSPSRDEFVGKKDLDFADRGVMSREVADKFLNDDLEVMKSGIAKFGIPEPAFSNPDGSVVYQISNKVPLYGSDGSITGVLGISTDITEFRR